MRRKHEIKIEGWEERDRDEVLEKKVKGEVKEYRRGKGKKGGVGRDQCVGNMR